MKKILLLAFALTLWGGVNLNATKLYATYGTPASNGAWNAETNKYSWTDSSNNLMPIFTFSSGELAKYTSIHLNTADYTDVYRICFMNGSTAVATIRFYSAGDKNIVFSERDETKNLDLSQITSINFGGISGSGSIVLNKAYLEKPMSLEFDGNGYAEIDITDLTASGCFSLDDQTGVLTSTYNAESSTWGRLSINFPSGGVDLSSLTGFSVSYTGTNLFSNFEIGNTSKTNVFWSNVTGRNDLNQHMTAEKVGNPSAITIWRWNSNSTAETMTITSIKLIANVVSVSNPHYTDLTAAMFHKWTTADASAEQVSEAVYPEYNLNESLNQGATVCGDGNVYYLNYADLTGFDKLIIKGQSGTRLRILMNRLIDNGKTPDNLTELTPQIGSDGVVEIDLTPYAFVHLNSIKLPYDGTTGQVNSLQLYRTSITPSYDYSFTGSGILTSSAATALSDATATSIDATGITAPTALTTANPNCLIVANEGMVTNASNVIVNGTCANLVLTDGKPFKAPADFTATAASYNTTISAAAQAGTLCLPFEATIPEGVTAYTLAYTSGDAATATKLETTIPANTPVLLNGSGAAAFTGSSVAIDADAANTSGAMTGVFERTAVPENSYVLQKQGDDVGFFKVTTTDIYAAPFRAYLTAQGSSSKMRIIYPEDVPTGIETLEADTETGVFYSLSGVRVAHPTKGIYIKNGKKVFVK